MTDPAPGGAPSELPEEVQKASADPKRRLGKYVLVKKVGKGGMGTVYRAWDTGLNRIVALKVLAGDTSATDLERFLREAHLAASLSHPNIAPIHEVGQENGTHFIAMQFIDGHTLEHQRPSPRRAAEIVRDLAIALDHAHRAKIIHRDIKPGNIMVDRGGRPYITDFGIAKSMEGKSHLTQEGFTLGTPSYMSPEQIHARAGALTPRTDIYSLGATLYHIVTGRPPFSGATSMETALNVLNKEPVPPARLARGISKDLEAIVLKCMDKDPQARYPTAQALAQDLDRFLRGEPIHARPPSIRRLILRKLRKNRALIPLLVAGVIIGIVAIVWMAAAVGWAGQLRDTLAEADRQYTSGRFQNALALYNQALALDEEDPRVRARISECKQKLREADRPRAEAEERQARVRAAAPDVERGKAKLEQAERDLYRPGADLDASRAKAAEAIATLEAALKVCPDHPEALTYRGRAHRHRLDLKRAEADFSRAIELDPAYAPALAARGEIRIRRWVDAIIDVGGRPLTSGPTHDEADRHRNLALADFAAAAKAGLAERQLEFEARLRFVEMKFDDCVAVCDRAIAANPTDEELHRLRGDACFYSAGTDVFLRTQEPKRLEAAVASYGRAIELRTNYADARAMRGVCNRNLGRNDPARADLESALRIDPGNFIALTALANLVDDSGRPEDYAAALKLYGKALEVKPDSYVARFNRSSVLAELGRHQEALEDIEAAHRLNPMHPYAWHHKGALLGRMGRLEEADKILTQSLSMDPAFPVAWYNRGSVRYKQGRDAEAIADFEEAIRRGHPRADEIRAIIDQLKRP